MRPSLWLKLTNLFAHLRSVTGTVPLLVGDVFVICVDIVGCVSLVETKLGEALFIVVPGVALVTERK